MAKWKCDLAEILRREGISGAQFCSDVEAVARVKGLNPPDRSTMRAHIGKQLWPMLPANVATLYAIALGLEVDQIWQLVDD